MTISKFVHTLVVAAGVSIAAAAAGSSRAAGAAPSSVVVDSPNGAVRISFGLSERSGESGVPTYSVSFRGRPLVHQAALGLVLSPSGPMVSGLRIIGVTRRSHQATQRVFPTKTSTLRDCFHESVVALREAAPPHRRLEIIFRAYDDGVAFRYRLPRQQALDGLTITDERTTFTFAGNPTAYTLPVPSYTTHYEFQYKPLRVRSVASDALLALPLLLEYPDRTSIAITEADLTDYAGMYLGGSSTPGTLVSRLSPRLDDPSIKVKASLPHDSPWRVLIIGTAPGRLVESNLVAALNPACAIPDTSWIHPGKTTFPWWNGYDVGKAAFAGGLNTKTMMYYIDFCSEHGIPYHSLDGLDNVAWYGGSIVPYQGQDITKSLPSIDLPAVIAYARQKGVRLRLWMHSQAVREHMRTAFPVYEKWGIEGVMVDFVERDDQETLNFIREMVALAARHHLTVTLHNISKPTGLGRTYPNLLTLESVYNLEYDKWDPVGSTPEHELTVPFTRMLAGPMDYHSGSFRNVTRQEFRPRNVAPVTVGTRARQLARYVVYEGALPMIADSPEAYRNQPGLGFLVEVPTVWDETRVLNGIVGQSITVARRSGRQWYVGSMTDSSARVVQLPLRFLGPGRFTAETWADDPNHPDRPTRLAYRKSVVTSHDTLRAAMAPAGGYVVRLTPADR